MGADLEKHQQSLIAWICNGRCHPVFALWDSNSKSDIDWDHATIRIVQSRQRRGGEDIIGSPKISGSIRQVVVSNRIVSVLREWRNDLEETANHRGSHITDSDFVLMHFDGTIIAPNTLPVDLRKVLHALLLTSSSSHDLRHAHATMLLQANVPLKVVSERLGHASITLTSNIIPT